MAPHNPRRKPGPRSRGTLSPVTSFLAESYLHKLDPFVVQFTETFGLRWYGLAYVTGFIVAWLLLRWLAATRRSVLTPEIVGDLLVYVILGVLLGGRLGHAIFYGGGKPFIEFSGDFPYWEILAIHRGGMSAHGGMIGVIIACSLFAYRRRVPALHLLDLAGFAACPGLFFGRIANFINAELWGKAIPADMQQNPPWWSIKYPQEVLEVWLPVATSKTESPEAVAQAEAKIEALVAALETKVQGGSHFFEHVVAIARDSSHKLHHDVVAVLEPMLTAYYPSQLIQALTDGPILMAALVLIWWKPRKAGVVGSWFLILYAVLRIITEIFRQPDEGVALLFGLSRGQVLSLVMLIVGCVCLRIALTKKGERILGLGPHRVPAAHIAPARNEPAHNEPRP